MGMLSPFIDLEELAEQAAKGAADDGVAVKPVDRTYPLASVEMNVLMQMHRDCRTQKSAAMRTWCAGDDEDSHLDEANNTDMICLPGITTHPCTGQILSANSSSEDDNAEFLWPWEGLRCDAFTNPTTVTHIYLPGEALNCELVELDLSVMVSLEQLDLSENTLYGGFPEWLGEMTMLRLLNLEGNQLTGDIPSSFAGNDALELINLSGNNLTASTLGFFDAFNRLQHLDLSDNKFALELSRNVLASKFLQTINFSHNGFHGELPQMPIYQFLEYFDVSSNFLTGNIPPQLTLWGREDPHDPDEDSVLALVNVSNNLFTGELPAISNQSLLQRFDAHSNNFGGFLPEFPKLLLKGIVPADFDGNAFTCPMALVLLPSNLICACGNGYTIKLDETALKYGDADKGDDSKHLISATQAAALCEPCHDGSYSNATTNQKCLPCPAGSSPEAMSDGKADHCKLCLPGTFVNESGSGAHLCTPCPPGTFVDGIGAVSCNLCNPGQFAAEQGSTNCASCGVGTFSSLRGATLCTSCPAGTYVNAEGEAECLMCPRGTYQDVVGSVECKACPVGYIAPQSGHVKCSPCSPGSFYDANTETCALCRPGTFTGAAALTECSKCENGTVAEGFGNEKCLGVAAAGAGYKSTLSTAKCDKGMVNDGKWRTCQPCPRGTFAAYSGSLMCSSCPKGSFGSSNGLLTCEKAPPGSFVPFEGALRAELCPSNQVATMNGSTACTPCQAPSFSFLPGGIACRFANSGEVYEHVEWPRLTLDLAGVEVHDLLDVTDTQVSPIEVLLQAWTDTLASYSGSSCPLHVLQVSQRLETTQLTQIIVALEMTSLLSTKTQADSSLAKKVGDAIHQATEAAESALSDLLGELNGSSVGKESQVSDIDQLTDVLVSSSFRDALVRQFGRANLFHGSLSFSMVNVSMVEPPFNSTRAVACAPGTSFFSVTGSSNESKRECVPCPVGSYSSTSGALKCERCPRGTFAEEEGLEMCKSCPLGADAAPGALSCVECSWFTYECEGFWEDVVAAVCIGAALLRRLYTKIRKLCVGDQAAQRQDEGVALMAAVRAHGRTFDGLQYAPMGMVSADTMFGSVSDTDNRL
ncbi:signal peptide, CUB domain, EGF-like 1 [Phytophthora pseudosyringae]|uniref:Signal peptide, CUB domain, EGF-like 1 n=1 Tax=Phytophthora pseudosyringae TaxID=221518 RepID=A0A8T1W7L0_9STRA|nr:signal peptide, CUB domain, EGF-like 1 [Phytophthora pseudosyringae]